LSQTNPLFNAICDRNGEFPLAQEQIKTDFSEIIAENFGANATYVETLLARWQSNPALVDESWRSYFEELVGSSGDDASAAKQSLAPSPAEAKSDGAAAKPAKAKPAQPATAPATETTQAAGEAKPLRGPAGMLAQAMNESRSVPTATSFRTLPVDVLDAKRKALNGALAERGMKVSFTHLIAFAILRALEKFPQMNDGFEVIENQPTRLKRASVNLGIAIDLEKKDGTRSLLVPNIKNANALTFSDFLKAYDDVVRRAREGKLQISDFQGTTISLTNPGTIGTVASTPRLMAGQSAIIATGAIEFPAEYQSIHPSILPQLGISKAITISNTYDHRIIQGAESGAFLARLHELLLGQDRFSPRRAAAAAGRERTLGWASLG
jgi:2-oxoglutarate dehydrogenase E1 component